MSSSGNATRNMIVLVRRGGSGTMGSAPGKRHEPSRRGTCGGSGLGSGFEHLPALVHAGLQVDVVGTAQFAGILVLDVGRPLQGVGGPAHPAPRRRCFSLGDGHCRTPLGRPTLSESRAYRGSVRPTLGRILFEGATAFVRLLYSMVKQPVARIERQPNPGRWRGRPRPSLTLSHFIFDCQTAKANRPLSLSGRGGSPVFPSLFPSPP